MRIALPLYFLACSFLAACVRPSDGTGAGCVSGGPESLKPETFSSIHIGMTRAQVEKILGKPGYSPTDGQDYYGTSGECEVEPGHMAQCTFVIHYRDISEPRQDTGRVTGCFWGGVGE